MMLSLAIGMPGMSHTLNSLGSFPLPLSLSHWTDLVTVWVTLLSPVVFLSPLNSEPINANYTEKRKQIKVQRVKSIPAECGTSLYKNYWIILSLCATRDLPLCQNSHPRHWDSFVIRPLACKKTWLMRFFGKLYSYGEWGYDPIPFLLDYVATGVSSSWPQYPVILHMVDTGGKALKGWWWIQRLVDSSGKITQTGIREILGLKQYRILLFDFLSLMETQWKENAAVYSHWYNSGMKPYDILT